MDYQGEIFVSTGAFGRMDLEDMLQVAVENGISHVELSSGAFHRSSNLVEMLRQVEEKNTRFLVHNYFPVPSRPFVLNLASDDVEMLERSRTHCKSAIDLAALLGAPFYSVHAGFCIHLRPEDLGRKLQGQQISKERAWDIFLESVKMLGEYAAKKDVILAIENNVVSPQNLRDGKNELLLGVTGHELKSLMEEVAMDSVRLLLDVAHLKVSAQSLSFDAEAAISQIAPWIIACHLSDNDGAADSNEVLTEQSWCWQPLAKYLQAPPTWVLEVYNISPDVILDQLRIIRSSMSLHNPLLVKN